MKLSDELHEYAVAIDAGTPLSGIPFDRFALQAGELEAENARLREFLLTIHPDVNVIVRDKEGD
jgi:hypothetical protein